MNLAKPAPVVETAWAEKAEGVESATEGLEAAKPSEAPIVERAISEGPAVPMDDPSKFAPPPLGTRRDDDDHGGKGKDDGGEEDIAKMMSPSSLRGKNGADFEGGVALLRGAPRKNLLKRFVPLVFDERDFVSYGEVLRYVIVKGNACFVFGDDKSEESPMYAINLEEIYPILEDPRRPDKGSVTISPTSRHNMSKSDLVTILFKYKGGLNNRGSKNKGRRPGEQAYQFTFDTSGDRTIAQRFFDVVERCSRVDGSSSSSNAIVTASAIKAKDCAKVAAKKQPIKEHNT